MSRDLRRGLSAQALAVAMVLFAGCGGTKTSDGVGSDVAGCPTADVRTSEAYIQSCPQLDDVIAGECPNMPPDPCAACPDTGYCKAGHCYDCSEEGFCNAVECEDDGNPCTLQRLDPVSGECRFVANDACREPVQNLVRLYREAQAHYGLWLESQDSGEWAASKPVLGEQLTLNEGWTPISGSCCKESGGPDADGDGACDPDPARFRTVTWRALGFDISGAHRFAYSFHQSGVGKPGEELFSVHARGDLDCDGKPIEFVLRGGFRKYANGGSGPLLTLTNKLSSPVHLEYVAEDQTASQTAVPTEWAVTQFLSEARQPWPFDAFSARVEDTVFFRHFEALEALARLHAGAVRYYSIPKAEVGAPGCMVSVPDGPLLGQLATFLPPYKGLHSDITPEASCCSGDWSPDADQDGMCDMHVGQWTSGAWPSIGFKMLGGQRYNYELNEESGAGFKLEPGVDLAINGRAWRDPGCDGHRASLAFRTPLALKDGSCRPVFGMNEQVIADIEFFPLEGDGHSVVIPAVRAMEHPLWPGTFSFADFPGWWSTLDVAAFGRVFEELDNVFSQMESSISSYFAENCAFPDAPATGAEDGWLSVISDACCWTGNFVFERWDGRCGPFPQLWSDPFWTALGFSVPFRHRFAYGVKLLPAGTSGTLVELEAVGDDNCNSTPSRFVRYGLAQKKPDGCSVQWLQGWHIEDMFE